MLEGDSAGRAQGVGGSGMLTAESGVALADGGRLGMMGVYLADQLLDELLGGVRGVGSGLLIMRGRGSGAQSEKSRRSPSLIAEGSGRAADGDGSGDGIVATRIGGRARSASNQTTS